MPYQKLEKPQPMAVPMEIDSEEEAKVPSMTEARARFDTTDAATPRKVSKIEMKPTGPAKVPVGPKMQPKPVPETMPKKVVPPVNKKPTPSKPEPMTQDQAWKVKSPSPRWIQLPIVSMMWECCANMKLKLK